MNGPSVCHFCGAIIPWDSWLVRINDSDSVSAGLTLRVCKRCAERAAEALETLRKAAV